MLNDHIGRAIADMASFLEFTRPPIIDEDASLKALEQMSYELCQADEITKRQLSILFEKIAPSYGDRADFVRSLPNSFGFF